MKRFLIANPFGIGDVLFSMASVQRLRQIHPDAFLGFICNERTEALLKLCPAIDRLHVFNRDGLRASLKKSPFLFLREVKKMGDEASAEKYDTLLDFSLGREFSAAAFFLGIPRRVGFDFKGRGFFLTHKKKIRSYADIPVAQAQMDLLLEKNILPDNRMPPAIEIRVPAAAPDFKAGEKILAVAPGGGRSWGKDAIYKQWDLEKFSEVIQALTASDPALQVVLLGDLDEKALLEDLGARLRKAPSFVWVGEPIAKVCAVLKRSDLLLCNDGGLMHLAHALGTKTAAIFGPVDEKVYGPYGGSAARRVFTHPVPCRPCYRDFHFPPCGFDRQCLSGLPAHKVIEAVREIL